MDNADASEPGTSSTALSSLQKIILKSIMTRMAEGHVSQAELCRRSGLNPSVLNRILKGYIEISTYQLERIARGLNVEPERLIFDDGRARTKDAEEAAEESRREIAARKRAALRTIPDEVPQSLREFLERFEQRLTDRERALLVDHGRIWFARNHNPATEYWLDIVRADRSRDPWPPPKDGTP